jgi:hypothetical protein
LLAIVFEQRSKEIHCGLKRGESGPHFFTSSLSAFAVGLKNSAAQDRADETNRSKPTPQANAFWGSPICKIKALAYPAIIDTSTTLEIESKPCVGLRRGLRPKATAIEPAAPARKIAYGFGSKEVSNSDNQIWSSIRFEPELDECLHVRNVKKGAEPIEGLREHLSKAIYKSIDTLREKIQQHWNEVAAKTMQEEGKHAEPERIVSETQRSSRKPKAGKNTTPEVLDEKVDAAAEALVKDVPDDVKPQKKKQLKERLKSQPYSVVAESWNGREMFIVEHLGLTTIVKLNMQHP